MFIVLKRHIDNLLFRFLPFEWSFKPITKFKYGNIGFDFPSNWFVLKRLIAEEFTFYNPDIQGALQLWCYFHKNEDFIFSIKNELKILDKFNPSLKTIGNHQFIITENIHQESNSYTKRWISGNKNTKTSLSMTFNLDSIQQEKETTILHIENILSTLTYS
ncbi:MAG: hypothetical protein ACJAR8_000150 [Bacteroidia bacterium]|jgi:hypothetical protein